MYESSLIRAARALPIAALLLFASGIAAAKDPARGAAERSRARGASATGCIDEVPGPQYVLRDDRERTLQMKLEPQGFPPEAFAKYLGEKVEVRGRIHTDGGTPAMAVRSVKRISGLCTPNSPGTQSQEK